MTSTATSGPRALARRTRTIAVLAIAVLGLGTVVVACGSDSSVANMGPVNVTLVDYKVEPTQTKAKTGTVTFAIRNDGQMTHEFVVFKTDLDPTALPLDSDGAVDEKGEGVEFVDERENIAPGGTAQLTLDLQPGKYVLVCNLEDHYSKGMHTAFTVTG